MRTEAAGGMPAIPSRETTGYHDPGRRRRVGPGRRSAYNGEFRGSGRPRLGLDRAIPPRRPIEGERVDEFVEPLGMRVLIRKDESRHTTRGGIVLPDQAEIPTITGRVVEVSLQVERDADFPIEKYDKVLFHPKNSIPVDFEQNNLLYVVPIEDVVAVFRRLGEARPSRRGKASPGEDAPGDGADR
jgi:chaperonin GroES